MSLRKENRLEEAYRMAEADLAQRRDSYSCSAMFWVLKDVADAIAEGQEDTVSAILADGSVPFSGTMTKTGRLAEIVSRMEELIKEMNDDQGYASRSLSFQKGRLMEMDDIDAVLANPPQEPDLAENVGWRLFRHMKERLDSSDLATCVKWLEKAEELPFDRPSRLNSLFLWLAAKVAEAHPDFILADWLERWNPLNFDSEDLVRQTSGDTDYPSRLETVLRECFNQGASPVRMAEILSVNPSIHPSEICRCYSAAVSYSLYKASSKSDREYFAIVSAYLSAITEYSKAAGQWCGSRDHSSVLTSIVYRLGSSSDNVWRFRDILEAWGMRTFMPEDWEAGQTEQGASLPSLVERAIFLYQDSVEAAKGDYSDDFIALVDEACRNLPRSVFVRRIRAKICLSRGNRAAALDEYRRILKVKTDYYLWSELADCTDDPALMKSALCRALSLKKVKDEFLGKLRLRLAAIMVAESSMPEALYELNRYHRLYSSLGWKISSQYDSCMARIPEGTVPARSNDAYYSRFCAAAEAFVYSDIPAREMIVVREQSAPGRPSRLILRDSSGTEAAVDPRRFGLSAAPSPAASSSSALSAVSSSADVPSAASAASSGGYIGRVFLVRLDSAPGRAAFARVLTIEPQPSPRELVPQTVSGPLRIRTNPQGRRYAIIGDVYIPHHLLEGLSDGDRLEVTAVRLGSRHFIISSRRL